MPWMRINYPGAYLMPKMRELGGSRQDLCLEGAPSVFINFRYHVGFQIEHLCVTENLLQKNLFVIINLVEMTSVLQFHAIMNISI